MTKHIIKTLLLLSLSYSSISLFGQENPFIIEVDNLKSSKGEIQIGLYRNGDSFPFQSKMYKVFRFAAQHQTASYELTDLPEGEYAFAFYHDENDNKVCDTNFIGYPLEGYCFSNNWTFKYMAPTFSYSKVEVKKGEKIKVNMIY